MSPLLANGQRSNSAGNAGSRSGSSTGSGSSGAGGSQDNGSPGDEAAENGGSAPSLLRRGGGSGSRNDQVVDSGEAAANRITAGEMPFPEKEKPPERTAPARPVRLSSNRDWVIQIECNADGVLLPNGQRLDLQALNSESGQENRLLTALKQIIDRRQATVRRGESPYCPQIRFQLRPDGLRAYYLAYPALEPLHLKMTREVREEHPEN